MDLSHQLYKNDANIVTLDFRNFDKKVTNSSQTWIVEFYSPRCRHCISFVNGFKSLSLEAKNEFPVGAVDCLAEKRLCYDYGINSFPRIAFMYKTFIIDYSRSLQTEDILAEARNAADDFNEL